jgi:hypothetical protein
LASIDIDDDDDSLKSLSVDVSVLVGGDSVTLVPGGLGDVMEDEELFEDEDGPDLSLDRHIAKVKLRKSCQEHF